MKNFERMPTFSSPSSFSSSFTTSILISFLFLVFLLVSSGTEAFLTFPSSISSSTHRRPFASCCTAVARAHFSTPPPLRSSTTQLGMSMTSTPPSSGDVVTVTYDLEPNGDFVPNPLFDDGTLTFVLHGGNYLPALHQLVSEMKVGESQTVTMDAGYGEPREELVAKVPIASSGISPSDLKIGLELFLSNGMKCRVVDLDQETFTIDANHPLAGATYTARVTLNGYESGPSEELFEYRENENESVAVEGSEGERTHKFDVLTIALGCFWGGELAYMRVPGVVGTSVGYTQGKTENPTYQEVCSGTTGHTEAIQVIFDPSIVSYEELVKIGLERLGESRYLLNQVGNDRGTQYRHGVYYHNPKQMAVSQSVIQRYGAKCVTECKRVEKFYKAEDYHQQYLLKGGQSAKKNAKEIIRCYG